MDYLLQITLLNVALLGLLLLGQPLVRDIKVGLRYTLSNFDKRVDEGVLARRLAMVCSNQIEALVLWVPTVAIGQLLAIEHSSLLALGATFLTARVAYAAVSLLGVPVLRSTFWTIGFGAWAYLAWIVWSQV
ncbi:MAG: MAPEG family protein [Pseudomonadota bacterium]